MIPAEAAVECALVVGAAALWSCASIALWRWHVRRRYLRLLGRYWEARRRGH